MTGMSEQIYFFAGLFRQAWREFAIAQNAASVNPVVDIAYGTPGRPFGSDHVPGSFHIKKRGLVA
jgi:hypothetical protein